MTNVFVKYMQDGFEKYETFIVLRTEDGGYNITDAMNYAESLKKFSEQIFNIRLEWRP